MEDMHEWPTGRLLSTAARLVEHAWNERLSEHGLTHAGVIALSVLDSGALPQSEIAARCRVEAQTMSGVLERLERQGHVTRLRDSADRRRLLVSRTATGAAVVDEAKRLERTLLPELGDVEQFREQLLALVSAMHGARWPPAAPRDGEPAASPPS